MKTPISTILKIITRSSQEYIRGSSRGARRVRRVVVRQILVINDILYQFSIKIYCRERIVT